MSHTARARNVIVGERFTHHLPGDVIALVEVTGTPVDTGESMQVVGMGTVYQIPARVLSINTAGFWRIGEEVTLHYFGDFEVHVVEEAAEERHIVRMVFDFEVLGRVDDRVAEALTDLAAVMLVQAEDGLYLGGNPDAEDAEFVADFGSLTRFVSITEVN